MLKRFVGAALVIGLVAPSLAATTSTPADAIDCPNDSKLIGRIEISTDDAPDTWWGITRAGLEAAGIIGDADLLATLNGWLGTTFTTLTPAVAALVETVRPFDKNENNYVCAFTLRGTRAYLGDPDYTLYSFGVQDDRD